MKHLEPDMCVNALNGLSSFLLLSRPSIEGQKGGVNALNGLSSFLQYLFKNLYFTRVPEPVFACICQNILNTGIFCVFL